jgi:ceramide glucosyltransferase
MSILKPVHGREPLLEEALASFCDQDHPDYQIVFGVQDAGDPALPIIARLRARFPETDMAIVIDPTRHGPNGKISNLINAERRARHDVLVIADSDMHVGRDYLRLVAAELRKNDVGLVTTLYRGVPGARSLAGRMGVAQINATFLPGVLLGRMFGRQDCLGSTMALRRDTLDAVGGLRSLVEHLADDNELGRAVGRLGRKVALAGGLTATTVPETGLRELFAHELRWGRTMRSVAPAGFALSVFQYPIIWSAACAVATGQPFWSTGSIVMAACVARWISMIRLEQALGIRHCVPPWMLPLREVLSVAVVIASYCGNTVRWKGRALVLQRAAADGQPAVLLDA